MGQLNSIFSIGKGRTPVRPSPLPPREFSRLVEQVSASIPDPLLKLRFINTALARYDETCRLIAKSTLNDRLCRQILIEVLDRLWPDRKLQLNHPALALALAPEPPVPPRRARRGPWLALLLLPIMMTCAAHRLQTRYGGPAQAKPASPAVPAPRPAVPADHSSPKSDLSSRAAAKPAADVAAPPEVWLVEKKPGYEFYSNGLRISTEYLIEGEPRIYRTITRETDAPSRPRRVPAGLLYHTSEGDLPPFQSAFNRSLAQHTRGLLAYIKQNRLYHYLIDRFGRVYRIVPDNNVAYHAGFSIWSDESEIYILLNQSFIGVCFEGRWTDPSEPSPQPLPPPSAGRGVLTRAQVDTGRQLTDLLRQTYQISDRNCVTHGLASVNPQGHLIGYHLDGAKDFPFRELGLEDKYQIPLPSITEFGFAYDTFFLRILGKPWAGVDLAMAQLKAQAEREHISYEVLKHKLNRRFDQQLAQVRGKPRPAEVDDDGAAPRKAGAAGG